MNKKLLPALIALSLSAAATAEVDVYGKLQLTVQNSEEGDSSIIELKNHSSRLGFKGSEETDAGITAIYQYELGINPDDSTTWSQRNSFLGFKGGFGTIKAGHFDTAFKSSQGKVNVFGDFSGDIQNIITVGDVRKSNSVAYTTPSLSGFSATVDYIMSEEDEGDDAVSASASYSNDSLYLAVAFDDAVLQEIDGVAVEDYSAVRLTGTYKVGPVQLGGMYESAEANDADSEMGWLASAKFSVSPAVDLKVEYGQSDIVAEGGELVSAGVDYHMSKSLTLLGYLTQRSADDDAIDESYVALGTILKF